MSQNNMNTAQALQVLDAATTPANAGKLNRLDYANIQIALAVLNDFVNQHTPKDETVSAALDVIPAKKRGPKPKTGGAFGADTKS